MRQKDEIYVLRQPEKTTLSIIIMKDEFPLSDKLHEDFEKLSKISDIILIFSDKYFPKSKDINKERFSNIYRVTGWIDSSDNLPKSIVKVLKYSKEIFNKHVTYTIMNSWEMNLSDRLINNIVLSGTLVTRPVYKTVRLSSTDYFNIYKKHENEDTIVSLPRPCNSSGWNFFKLRNTESTRGNLIKDTHLFRSFSSYTTKTSVFLFKAVTANNLISFFDDPLSDEYIETFDWEDFRYCFASLIKRLNIETVDVNIEDLDLENDSNKIKVIKENGNK